MPGLPPDPDADLVRRWQRGDRAAFEAIVRRWSPRVGRFLVRMTGNPDLARDLTQETFLRLFQAPGRYREQGRFSTWLFQVAVNLARDAARRNSRRPAQPLAYLEPEAGDDPVDGHAQKAEAAAAVAAALAELPEPLREVVLLRHYEDLSFEAMARLLGAPATTLKSRFTVAIRRLQHRLASRGFAPEDVHEDL